MCPFFRVSYATSGFWPSPNLLQNTGQNASVSKMDLAEFTHHCDITYYFQITYNTVKVNLLDVNFFQKVFNSRFIQLHTHQWVPTKRIFLNP